jgi:hypothetical protein
MLKPMESRVSQATTQRLLVAMARTVPPLSMYGLNSGAEIGADASILSWLMVWCCYPRRKIVSKLEMQYGAKLQSQKVVKTEVSKKLRYFVTIQDVAEARVR